MRRLKVLVADDHRLMLAAVKMILEQDPEFSIVGEAISGSQVLPLVGQTDPDVVLLDLRMPGMDGLACLEAIRTRYPAVKVVMLSGHDDPAAIRAAFQRGASSFVSKQIAPRDLASAIRQAYEGTVFQAAGTEAYQDDAAKDLGLTERELSILSALGTGLANKQIAKQLWLAEQTVKFHLTNIYRKLGVSSRTEAVRFAYRHGLVENPVMSEEQIAV